MFKDLRELLLPPVCVRCQNRGEALCSHCADSLKPRRRFDVAGLDDLVCLGPFDGWLRDAVIAYKTGNRHPLRGCAQAIVVGLPEVLGSSRDVLMVPIPSQRTKISERGFDPVGLIAAMASRIHGLPTAPLLTYQRQVKDQVGLDASARRANVDQCFIAVGPSPAHVLLLDDVVTTGATLSQAALACKKSGASKVSAITLCG